MKYFKKNMHYLLVTLYLFSSQINAFSFDNNDLNIGIPISEKTYTNKTFENRENNNFTFPADAGEDEDICFGDGYIIGGDIIDEDLYTYNWTSSNVNEVFQNDDPNPKVYPNVTTTYTLTVEEILTGNTDTDFVTISIIEIPIDSGTTETICLGQEAEFGENEDPGYNFTWESSPNDPNIDLSNPWRPKVTPNQTTTYTLTKTSLNVFCLDGTTGASANAEYTVNVEPVHLLNLTSPTNTDLQVLCDGFSLETIIYEFNGGATNATITGLPPGVSGSIAGNNLTISGTPPAATNATQVYSYTVTTSGTGPCAEESLNGTITVNPNDELSLSSGTDSQELCEGNPITNIIYEFSGGANDANVSGLPAGVTTVVTSNNITILGTPTGPISTPTTFNYTVTTQGGNCQAAELNGTITVNPNDVLSLFSAVGTNSQVLCDTDSFNTIVYEFSGGATTATVSGLPVGVTFDSSGGLLTI
ncbi:hypothetical protein OAT87_01285, partial [Flavobacteriaceae bacterium]|nr:hypothetical protein [Flavobacteriaceae bacterium]